MDRIILCWISVIFACNLSGLSSATVAPQLYNCTNQCQNKSIYLSCVAKNLTQVPSSNECHRVFSLVLDNNWIDLLRTDDFASFCGLDSVLSLNGNRIKTIDFPAFRNLSDLTKLELNGNNITNLSTNAFEGLTSLKRLSLNENQLAAIGPGVFSLTNAEILLLGANAIQSIQRGSFGALRNLKELYLRSNRIRRLLNFTFSGLTKLNELDLSDNDIYRMEVNAFKGLTNLKRLNLSRNEICSVAAVYDLWLMKVLDLSFNNVTNLNTDNKHLDIMLTSQRRLSINVSNNPLRCDCSIEPLLNWYSNLLSPEGDTAQCDTPQSLHGTPLTNVSIQDECSKNMVTTSQLLRTKATTNSNDAMVGPGVDEATESSWTLPVMCAVLGLLGLALTLAMTRISFRKCKRLTPSAVHQMVSVETADVRTETPPITSQQRSETMQRTPAHATPTETTPQIPSRPPMGQGVPALPPILNRSLPQVPDEGHHWTSPNAPCLSHHAPSWRQVLRQGLSSHLVRDYTTSVEITDNPIASPTDVHIITTPCSPSAAGPSTTGFRRVPKLSNHTAGHNYSLERGGFIDHLRGCQMRSAAMLIPPSSISCSCTYMSIHGTDSVTQTPRWKPCDKTSPKVSTRSDPMTTDLAPDTPEYGLKLGRNGIVQIVSMKEIVRGRGLDDSRVEPTATCPQPQSALYAAV